MNFSSGPPNALLTALFGSGFGACNVSQGCSRIVLRDLATREFNAFLWFFLIAITGFLANKVVKLLRLWAKANCIPGPPSPSFYGHSKLISRENLTGQLNFFENLILVWLPRKLPVTQREIKVQWNIIELWMITLLVFLAFFRLFIEFT